MGATMLGSCRFRGKKDLARKRVRGRDQLGTITVPELSAALQRGSGERAGGKADGEEGRICCPGGRGEIRLEPGWAARKSILTRRAWAEGSPVVSCTVSSPPDPSSHRAGSCLGKLADALESNSGSFRSRLCCLFATLGLGWPLLRGAPFPGPPLLRTMGRVLGFHPLPSGVSPHPSVQDDGVGPLIRL